MNMISIVIRIFIWYLIWDTTAAAGTLHSPFLLLFSIAAMTYWYWRYPIFKEKEEKQED